VKALFCRCYAVTWMTCAC